MCGCALRVREKEESIDRSPSSMMDCFLPEFSSIGCMRMQRSFNNRVSSSCRVVCFSSFSFVSPSFLSPQLERFLLSLGVLSRARRESRKLVIILAARRPSKSWVFQVYVHPPPAEKGRSFVVALYLFYSSTGCVSLFFFLSFFIFFVLLAITRTLGNKRQVSFFLSFSLCLFSSFFFSRRLPPSFCVDISGKLFFILSLTKNFPIYVICLSSSLSVCLFAVLFSEDLFVFLLPSSSRKSTTFSREVTSLLSLHQQKHITAITRRRYISASLFPIFLSIFHLSIYLQSVYLFIYLSIYPPCDLSTSLSLVSL